MKTRSALVGISLLVCALAPAALATTRTVTIPDDSGTGSLRKAILDSASGDTIDFDLSAYPLLYRTITLTSGELLVDTDLTIAADPHQRISVSGGKTSRVFHVAASVTAEISGLTIRDGSAQNGAGLYNQGHLTVTDTTIKENASPSGLGGGILNEDLLTLRSVTVSGNVAIYGGGIENQNGARLIMSDVTVSGNVAVTDGGGIDNFGAGSVVGSAFSTIAFNRAGSHGGGINAEGGDVGAVKVEKTILANNAAAQSPNCSGTLTSYGYNLLRDASGCTLPSPSTVTGDPRLGALQTNGAGPATHALRPGSAAIDVIPGAEECDAGGPFDARGVARKQSGTAAPGTLCDIGAYEAQTPIVVNSLADPTAPSQCTLRDALLSADDNTAHAGCKAGNATIEMDRIVFDPSLKGRIRLTAELHPVKSVLVEGPGATLLTISGERTFRVFSLGDESGDGPSGFGIAGLTIANGQATDLGLGGGVLMRYADRPLAIDAVAFEDNANLSFGGDGASLYVDGVAPVEIDSSTFVNTRAACYGASVTVVNSEATITNSTFGETRSQSAVESRTFQDGVRSLVRLVSSTLRGSEPSGARAVVGTGADAASARLEYRSSVIAGHGTDVAAVAGGVLASGGYNVLGDASGPAAAEGDVKSADPKLDSLLWGGGRTKTLAPLPGSPAIDRVPIERCAVTVDQRGVLRPLDGTRAGGIALCDSGAFETAPPIVVNSLLDATDSGKCRLRDAVDAANTNAAAGGCPAGLAEAPDLITFSVNGTIALGSSLQPSSSVAVRGPGASRLTISGQGSSGVFDLGTDSTSSRAYTLTGMTIANGLASGIGGGVSANLTRSDTVSISDSVFRNDRANVNGGALYSGFTTVQLVRSTFTNPSGTSASSFLIFNETDAEIEDCTVNDTSSTSAIKLNATFGGVLLRLKSSTISGSDPTGISLTGGNARAEYSGTIVSGHAACFNLAGGTGVSLGYNLSSDATGNLTATGDKPSTNPLLGPLGYHGGQTPVFDLKPASPAKDAIPTADCGEARDQRGFARPFGSACDIGAVERRSGGDADGNGIVQLADVFYLINYLFAGGPVPIGEPDSDGDAAVSVADVFYLINYLFAGGPSPE